ncbi:secondary thiamine-phosphate synthase enzyme YjbQ [Pantanalinema rosaneae CENA516]|uniref:secondary thiamine-phosphate synthase enzyme YjbQ n=1 Tax=Pantanalinema rosaneae TaxID=1620701 RepID=UPI003D6EE959
MPIANHLLTVATDPGIQIYDITPKLDDLLSASGIQSGQMVVFSRHTTTALAINEYEPRLLDDLKVYLRKLAPETDRYLHNDLHLRVGIPEDEPMNAHSHLMAMTLSTSEVIPVIDGKLALGTYQSVLLFELDGPRQRTVLCQISGE